jgi:hypothetical protein
MEKGSWLVRVRCTVVKEVVSANCTEEEAITDPWDHAEDERELEQVDWEVEGVTPNN